MQNTTLQFTVSPLSGLSHAKAAVLASLFACLIKLFQRLPTGTDMLRLTRILATHCLAIALGFALGIFLLPVLTAPPAPSDAEVASSSKLASFNGMFQKDLPGSDFLHWGEGTISLSAEQISFIGSLAPGPDYKLYLTPELVLTEQEFLAVKADSARVGDVRTFDNFILAVPQEIDLENYKAVIIWCESFGEFITAASYR